MLLPSLSLLNILSFVLGVGVDPELAAVEVTAAPPAAHTHGELVAERIEAQPQAADRETRPEARPTRWMPKLRRCARRAGRRFCDGPRMVPVAALEDAARAARLELGTRRTASRLLIGAPDPEWVLEAGPATLDLAWPVDAGQVSRGYGFVRRQALRHRRHDGIDFSAARGTAVRAANHGLVAYADNGVSGFGNIVIIVHGDGSTTLYAHLQEAHVTAGQLVEREQTIGRVGNTGLSRGPHLHFEWRKGGRPIDPARALHRPGDEHDHARS